MTDLLKAINWYKPASIQRIKLSHYELKDSCYCGIKVIATTKAKTSVSIVVPEKSTEELPTPDIHLLTNRRLSVVSQPLDTVYAQLKTKSRYPLIQKNLTSRISKYCQAVLEELDPIVVYGVVNWGFSLSFLHEAARLGLPVIGYKHFVGPPPKRWYGDSRMSYGYLLGAENVQIISVDTLRSAQVGVIRLSDFCVNMSNDRSKIFNSVIKSIAQHHNIPIIRRYDEAQLLE